MGARGSWRSHVLAISAIVSLLMALPVVAYAITPSNDDMELAENIPSLPFDDVLDTTDATSEINEPDCFGTTATVWYSFTPGRDMEIAADTLGSGYDTNLAVFRVDAPGDVPTGADRMVCEDDFPGSKQTQVTFGVRSGQSYLIRVGSTGPFGGSLVFSVREVLPPSNDSFSSAKQVANLPYEDAIDTAQASVEPTDPSSCAAFTLRTVWYTFQPATTGYYLVSTQGSDYDTTLTILRGSPGSFSEVTCDADGVGLQSEVVFKALSTVRYAFMVSATSPDSGNLDFSVTAVPAPANDLVAAPTNLQAPTFANATSAQTEITGATNSIDDPDPSCADHQAINSVWYRFTPTVAGTHRITAGSENSGHEAIVAVYSNNAGTLEEIACSDDQPANAGPEVLDFEAVGGDPYLVLVQSTAMREVGRTTVQVGLEAIPDPIEFTFEVDPLGFASSKRRGAVVQGEVQCSRAGEVELSITLEQSGSGGNTGDSEFVRLDCGSAKRAWSVKFGRDAWRGGDATVEFKATAVGKSGSPHEANVSKRGTLEIEVTECTLIGTAGNDKLVGHRTKRDKICGLSGNDRISGLGGDDKILAGGGADIVKGGDGDDFLYGGDGQDELNGGPGFDTCRHAEGQGSSKDCEKE